MIGVAPEHRQGFNDGNGYGSLNIACHGVSVQPTAGHCHRFFTKNLTKRRSFLTGTVNNLLARLVI